MYKLINSFIILLFIATINLYSQDSSLSASYLRICPSAANNAIGGAGVALPLNNAFGLFFNPAFSAVNDHENTIKIGMNLVDTYPFQENVVKLAISGSLDLSRFYKSIPLSIGLGFMKQKVELETATYVDEGWSVRIEHHLNRNWANTFNFSVSWNDLIKAGLGFNFKTISYEYYPTYNSNPSNQQNEFAFDFGAFIAYPIFTRKNLFQDYKLDFDIAIGGSVTNIGDGLYFTRSRQVDYKIIVEKIQYPFPRTIKIGYSINSGIERKFLDSEYKFISLNWTAEVEDLLLKWNKDTLYYKSVAGNINPLNNLILLKSEGTVKVRFGARLGLFESLYLSYGRMNTGNLKNMNTYGISFHTDGIVRFLDNVYNISNYSQILKYLSIRYNFASLTDIGSTSILNQYGYYHGIDFIIRIF
ncbi:MAG: hypothetical protein HW421_1926 [Ignavibacteria bacterium]|nr:hypothetical protein [Ignavibacteria bacterium]